MVIIFNGNYIFPKTHQSIQKPQHYNVENLDLILSIIPEENFSIFIVGMIITIEIFQMEQTEQ